MSADGDALDLDELERIARAATPGPWRATTFDPATVLALIERVRAAEAAVERVRAVLDKPLRIKQEFSQHAIEFDTVTVATLRAALEGGRGAGGSKATGGSGRSRSW